jgi:hypothetical protein
MITAPAPWIGSPMKAATLSGPSSRILSSRAWAACRPKGQGAAVVGLVAANKGLLVRLARQVPVVAHQAHDGVVGVGAGAAEEHVIEPLGGQLHQLVGQLDGRRRGGVEEGVVVGQFQHLPVGRIGQLPAPVAHVDAPQAGHGVEDLVALGILEPDAVGLGDDPAAAFLAQALGVGEGVQVVAEVAGPPLGRGIVESLDGHDGDP